MTVCIAIRWYDKIVFAADKKVSFDWFSYDGHPKNDSLTINAQVMASSENSIESDEIILKTQNKFREELKGKKYTIKEIAEILSDQCKLKYETELDEKRQQVYSRYKLDPRDLKSKSKSIPDRILQDVVLSLRNVDEDHKSGYFKAEFIVVGIDEEPHIYVVDQTGKIQFMDPAGFAVIGSGQLLAFPEMIRLMIEPPTGEFTLSQAIVMVHNAKRRAESAMGVGKLTDLIILEKNKEGKFVRRIASTALLKKLDKNFDTLINREMKFMFKRIGEIEALNKDDLFRIHTE